MARLLYQKNSLPASEEAKANVGRTEEVCTAYSWEVSTKNLVHRPQEVFVGKTQLHSKWILTDPGGREGTKQPGVFIRVHRTSEQTGSYCTLPQTVTSEYVFNLA